mgnify:CR=1 FL=1
MKLYEYAIILHPTESEAEDGKKSEIVVDVSRVLAGNEREAMMHASRAIPAEFENRLDQLEIAIRPF